MKNIEAILKDAAPSITEDEAAAIAKEVKANYKTVADWQRKADRVTALEEQVAALGEQVEKVQGADAEIEQLRAQVKAFSEAEERRKADEAERESLSQFRKTFDNALDGRTFANPIVEQSVFQQVYEACKAEAGKSAKDALATLTANLDGVWTNPQRDPQRMPKPDEIKTARGQSLENRTFFDALFGSNS